MSKKNNNNNNFDNDNDKKNNRNKNNNKKNNHNKKGNHNNTNNNKDINKNKKPDYSKIPKENFSNLLKVEKILNYEFNDKNILNRALTHKSYNVQNHIESGESYQRMEYLGDALLDFIIADELYKNFPEFDEGMMSKIRASVVSKSPLAKIIENIGIINYILYDKQNTSLSDKLKSDIFESLVAGIYLDSNSIKCSKDFILKYLRPLIANEITKDIHDYKSILYEHCTKNNLDIEFILNRKEGPDHNLVFFYDLYIDKQLISQDSGKSKREATQKCSKKAIVKLGVMK